MRLRTGITRPFHLGDPGNRAIVVGTPVLGALAGLCRLLLGDGWGEAVRTGFSVGGAAFLGWALARELHPDRRGMALVVAGLSAAAVLRGDPDLLATATVMVIGRIVAGTTGRGVRWFDLAVVAAITLPLGWRATGAPVLTASAIALGLALRVEERHRRELMAAVVLLVAPAALAWSRFSAGFVLDWWIAPLAVLGLGAFLGPRMVTVGTDRTGGLITPGRVQAARVYTWVAAAAAAMGAPPSALGPVWATLAVVALRPR